ncbi:MAG: serine hydrolase domain-containing protein [Chloroflexota bacterium]
MPELAAFDQAMQDFVFLRGVPGLSVAVVYGRRLVFARSYSDTPGNTEVIEPTSQFRIASLSKQITATAVLRLAQEGRLNLDATFGNYFSWTTHPSYVPRNPSVLSASPRQALYHRSGLPMPPDDFTIANTLQIPIPITLDDKIRYMLQYMPMRFAPDTDFEYNNFAYLLLGRLIEVVSGQDYNSYVQQNVLNPLGIVGMRIGRTRPQDRLPGEVRYYSQDSTLYPNPVDGSLVPVSYVLHMESELSDGAWIASAADMARFVSSFEAPDSHPVLSAPMINLMFSPNPVDAGANSYYAMGWNVNINGDGTQQRWHDGGLTGTSTGQMSIGNGVSFAFLFNHDGTGMTPPLGDIWGTIGNGLAGVSRWPRTDLFPVILPDSGGISAAIPSAVGAPLPALDWHLDPNYGSVTLQAGFTPDPYTLRVESGGAINISALNLSGGACYGYATSNPDFRVQWSGTSGRVRFFFVADDGRDTLLIVSDAAEAWQCNDDGEAGTLNPLVEISNPPAGQYDLWVASYTEGEAVAGTLYITELLLSPTHPTG